MAELIIGASYPARRSGAIVVGESKQGALMVYVPFTLTGGIQFAGNHSVCIGLKDGSFAERAIQGLHEIFPAWENWDCHNLETFNPFDLQRMELPEGDSPEFVLADYHNEPYTPQGKSEEVDSFKFRWLNKLGSGIAQATDEEESATLAKWCRGKSSAPTTVKPAKTTTHKTPVNATVPSAEKPVEKVTPKRALPTKTKPVEARKETAESVMTLLAKKHGKDENDADAMQELGDKFFFPAQDKLFGENVSAETPEQWGQVANELGL